MSWLYTWRQIVTRKGEIKAVQRMGRSRSYHVARALGLSLNRGRLALGSEYGKNKWWNSVIQSYDDMKRTLKGQGLEQNHLVHAMFFRNGPPETRHLVGEVPCLTLSAEEHRGAKTSYHNMKDGTVVGQGKRSFAGCGMDGYLIGRGIRMKGPFTRAEIVRAIDASADYWKMIGMEHCVEAIGEFKQRFFAHE